MKWLKEQNRRTHEFMREEFASSLWMAGAAFVALLVLGIVMGCILPTLAENFVLFFSATLAGNGVVDESGNILFLPLLFNNLRAAAVSVCYGFIPFLFLPALSLGLNSLLIGFFAAYYLNNGMDMLYFLASIVPHGILEIPALVISIALGLYLCRVINDYARHSTKGTVKTALGSILRVYCLRAAPLFIAAALIECYITPRIITFI